MNEDECQNDCKCCQEVCCSEKPPEISLWAAFRRCRLLHAIDLIITAVVFYTVGYLVAIWVK